MRRILKISFLFAALIGRLATANGQTTLDTAVDFNVKDIHGNKYILFDLLDSNKFVLLDFFSTSCGPCVTYAPDMQQAYLQYGANQGDVIFLGMAWELLNSGVASFDSTNGITYPTVSGQGYSYQVITAYNCQSFPTTILIAPNRQILAKQIWPPSFQKIDSVLSAALIAASGPAQNPVAIELLSFFPNPVTTLLTCRLNLPEPVGITLEVFAFDGKLGLPKLTSKMDRGLQTIDIHTDQLKAGMYFVKLTTDKGRVSTFKFSRQ